MPLINLRQRTSAAVSPIFSKTRNFLPYILIAIIAVLLISNIFFAVGYFNSKKDLKSTEQALKNQQINEKVVGFTGVFISKVLKAEKEISFEDRLKLENLVRDLNDEEIFNQWQKFVGSNTEEDAQKEVKNLLEVLTNKIIY